MMSEAIDETLDKDEAEEETEDLTNQVCYCNSNHKIHTYLVFSKLPLSDSFLCIVSFLQVLDEIGVGVASQVS